MNVAGVGEGIEIEDGVLGFLHEHANKVAADKSGAACN